MNRASLGSTTVAVAATALASAALAGEVCVTCAEPAATYRCALEGHNPSSPAAAGVQLLCIKEMAGRAGHNSCTIDRGRTLPCEGEVVLITPPTGGVVPAVGPPGPAVPENDAIPAPVPGPAKPPETVEALAKQTAAQSKKDWDETTQKLKDGTKAAGEDIKNAGTNVGVVAKKSWDCVTSLFSKC